MGEYRSRVVDAELRDLMQIMGSVLIDGPKAVGKTLTAMQEAATVFRVDTDPIAQATLAAQPERLFASSTPILFDEWQETPELWNLVRRAVDDHDGRGLYLLTGSATPRDTARMHSGAGRIGRLRMRPMSLAESGHSDASVSLAALLAGEDPHGGAHTLTISQVLERVVVGGWPESVDLTERQARRWLTSYLGNLVEVDLPAMGPRRNPGNIRRLLASLARFVGTPLNRTAVATEVGGQGGPIDERTLANYLDALERLMLIEPLPAWQAHMRSRTRLRTTPVHHFVDPSIGTAALGVGVADLEADLNAAGFHFESLVLRDLRVYAQPLEASVSSWRDTKLNREVDGVIELPNGRWAAFEVKLGESAVDAAAEGLLYFSTKVDTDRHGPPVALIVVTGGRYAYRRPDGVVVVPLSLLGP